MFRLRHPMKYKLFVMTIFVFLSVGKSIYGQLRNLSVTSYDVVAYNVFSDKLTLSITVRNDSTDFTIRSFTGLVYQNRYPIITITSANVFISHGISTIGVVCNVSRCYGVTVFRLAQCLFPFEISDYTIDVSVAVQYPSSGLQYKERKNISLSSRIEML